MPFEEMTLVQKCWTIYWIIIIVTFLQILSNAFSAWARDKLEERRKKKEQEEDD